MHALYQTLKNDFAPQNEWMPIAEKHLLTTGSEPHEGSEIHENCRLI